MPALSLTLLCGAYAQQYYLGDRAGKTLTETVRNWAAFAPGFVPTPHPSPRNNLWLRKNPWFEAEVVPYLRERVHGLLGGG
jgi:uracil-DNA glycosylase